MRQWYLENHIIHEELVQENHSPNLLLKYICKRKGTFRYMVKTFLRTMTRDDDVFNDLMFKLTLEDKTMHVETLLCIHVKETG